MTLPKTRALMSAKPCCQTLQAEEGEENPQIKADDGVFLEFADRSVFQALFRGWLGGAPGCVCDIWHGLASTWTCGAGIKPPLHITFRD
jgi:hypothetical protein